MPARNCAPVRAGTSLHVVFMLLSMLRGAGRERYGLILRTIAGLVEENKLRV
jgi:hypothetical protein